MRKTTEELWKQALSEQTVGSDVPETFRRLAIENERECAEAVGVTASLPGTNNGYTFVAFNGSDVPVGTKLFAFPPAAIDRDSVIEALQLAHDHMRLYLPHYTEKHNVFDTVTRALKSQLAALDPRAEAQVPEWQPIETAPKELGKRILGLKDCGEGTLTSISIVFWLNDGEWYINDCAPRTAEGFGYRVTHWMPLPAAPEVKP